MKLIRSATTIAVVFVTLAVPKTATAGWQYTELRQFGRMDQGGQTPNVGVIRASDKMLYGATALGGLTDDGTIYRINAYGGKFQVLHCFTNGYVDGSFPAASLVEGSDGYLYGTTFSGGSQQAGVIYKVSKDGSNYQIAHTFGVPSNDGWRSTGPLMAASDGALYGMTPYGGENFAGVLFKLTTAGDYEVIHAFGGIISGGPNQLIEGHDGKLYGTCNGGDFGEGVIFRLNEDGSDFQELHSFNGSEGGSPNGPLIQTADGHLMGVTDSGGAHNGGVLFRINEDGSGFAVECNFESGGSTLSPLVRLNGQFYGVSTYGGTGNAGTLFVLNPADGSFKVLRNFDNVNDIVYPAALSVVGSLLYGVGAGGHPGDGTLFIFSPASGETQIVHNFDVYGGDGITPLSRPRLGEDGQLYGTTFRGGAGGGGTVYSIATDGSAYRVRWSFPGLLRGQNPQGIALDTNGMLYGATLDGGRLGHSMARGMIFRLSPNGHFKELHGFSGIPDDGLFPTAPLLIGKDGKLYGSSQVAQYGGYGARNAIFSLDKNGRNYHQLCTITNLSVPSFSSPELADSDGALYGGFVNTVFKVNKDGTGYQLLHVFTNETVSTPLFLASDGKLYGGTDFDFENTGKLYRINQDGSGFEMIFDFSSSNSIAGMPKGALAEGPDAMLYGVTILGSHAGQIFRIHKDGTGFEVLHVFDQGYPYDGLTPGPDGAWYGTTLNAGPVGLGSIFKLVFVPDALQ